MRVKVGAIWVSTPVCVELTEADKQRIAAMPADCMLYAQFADNDARSDDEKREWMAQGLKHEALSC